MPNKRQRILFLNRFFYPSNAATAQMLADLSFYLAENGFEVDVIAGRIAYCKDPSQVSLLPKSETIRGVHVHRVWSTRWGGVRAITKVFDYLTFLIGALWKLCFLAKRADLIVFKTDPPMLGTMGMPIARFFKKPYVAWMQDIFPEVIDQYKKVFGLNFIRCRRNKSLSQASGIVVLGEQMKEYLQSQLDNRNDRIHILPNWAKREEVFPIEGVDNPLKKEWGLSDFFSIGYSGNMGRLHLNEPFDNISNKMIDQPDVRFLYVGGGVNMAYLKRAHKARDHDNCVFHQYQSRDKLGYSLSVPDVHWFALDPSFSKFVYPSKLYGILAAGRPVILIGDVESDMAKLIMDYNLGYAIDPHDSEKIIEKINLLKSSPEMRKEMGENGHRLFLQNYDFTIIAPKWKALIQTILHKEGSLEETILR